ncbi:LPXTG cell wall anchor domain-containing protein, partial [Streptomyces sp. CS149]
STSGTSGTSGTNGTTGTTGSTGSTGSTGTTGGDQGGSSATGGSTTGGDDAGCTVDLDGAECTDNTDTDSVGNKPVEQSKGKEELAETGAAETTFLVIGAATMIAGGIGFRILPRLVGGGRTVA